MLQAACYLETTGTYVLNRLNCVMKHNLKVLSLNMCSITHAILLTALKMGAFCFPKHRHQHT